MEIRIKRFSELSAEELYTLLKLRQDVFILEQKCFYPDLDDCDQDALHIWLEDDDGIAAYLRLMDRGVKSPYVTMGRVVAAKRGCGLGAEIVRQGISAAKERFHADTVYLEAQCYAQGFYEKLGFHPVSKPFDEDGIMHIGMIFEMPMA